MMMILSHCFFLFGITSITHIFFCFILFVLPLVVEFLMELCPLLFCHNLPVNVIDQISINRSCSNNSVFLCRGIRGCCSSSCVLHYRDWRCHSRGDRASFDGCFLIVIPGTRIGSINQVINECSSPQWWISPSPLTTWNVSVMWGSGFYKMVTLYPSCIHATQNMQTKKMRNE